VNAAHDVDPENPALHAQLIQLRQTLDPILGTLPAKTKEVIGSESAFLPKASDLKSFNADYRKRHADSVEHSIAGIKAATQLLGEDKAKGGKELAALLDTKKVTLEQAEALLAALKGRPFGDAKEVEVFKEKARGKFPHATAFGGS
jgi:N-alpha-acetyltransferase 15/16, NatA auxiliary subunit